jgi:hypothetical protein
MSSLFDIVLALSTSCIAVGMEGASRLGILSLTPDFDSIALTNVLVKQSRGIRFTYTRFTTVKDTGGILEETRAEFGKDGSGTTVGEDIGMTVGPTVGVTVVMTAGMTAWPTARIPVEARAGTTVGITVEVIGGTTVGIPAGVTAGTIVGLTPGVTEGTTAEIMVET